MSRTWALATANSAERRPATALNAGLHRGRVKAVLGLNSHQRESGHRDATTPPEAREIVKLCDRLPLALGIAGKLVQEMGVTDNWDGVVELMQEEFSDSGQDRSMEERIIRTSLNAIKGPHRDKILRLFNAFAIVPEDTRTPIEMVAMLFEAESETPLPKPPSLLNIRRWLKVLID